jgi:hypothetical protein
MSNSRKIRIYKILSIFLISLILLNLSISPYIPPSDDIPNLEKKSPNITKPSNQMNFEIDKESQTGSRASHTPRYLENIIQLNDPEVQLTVISANEEDNTNNNGNIPVWGNQIATGDIDNDGFDDLILGSPYANGAHEQEETAGQVMVVYGRGQTHPGTVFDQGKKIVDEIGLVIHGVDGNAWLNVGDMLGSALACGDIDGDGYDDLVIGAPMGDSLNNQRVNAGEVYVIFGGSRQSLGTEINLAITAPDVMIHGAYSDLFNNPDYTGYSVAVGDVIGDSKDDIIIGAPGVTPNSRTDAGVVWVIAGRAQSSFSSQIDLRNGVDLLIGGADPSGLVGLAVTAGDVNGDGRDDILIGAPYADFSAFKENSGAAYVVYGKTSFSSNVDLRGGANVVIEGANGGDRLGSSLAVGNINGDSYNDIILGAPWSKGPNNGLDNSGEAVIIYGSPTLASSYDLQNNAQDVIIYGKNSNDVFGLSIAMGNIDNDDHDDLLINAVNGDGQYDQKSNCGETYLIMGNSTANLGSSIDVFLDSTSIFYGGSENDASGISLGLGDFDSDGFDDIAIYAPRGDGPNENRFNAGEFYLIFSHSPPIENLDFELVDGDIDGNTILTRYKTYIFRVNVTNILGYKDVKSVTLILDPIGYNIKYNWIRAGMAQNNKFTQVNDPLGMVECLSTVSDAVHDSHYNYSINFKFKFNWSFNKSFPIDCIISSVGKRSLLDEDVYPDVFKVNNKLNFMGELKIYGSIQGEITDNSWVAGGETLSFTGLTVIYDGTMDYFPPKTEFALGIEDNLGITTIVNPNPGGAINGNINTPELTVDYKYRVKILDIPSYSDNSSIKIELKIDNDPPIPPGFVICKADELTETEAALVDDDTEIILSWDASVDKGSGISGYYYSFQDNSETENGFWTSETASKLTNATEGVNLVYVWAKDKVGNIGKSSSSGIFIDLTEVTFLNFTPISPEKRWFNSKTVNCTLQIKDQNGFGVDPDNIWWWSIQSNRWVKVKEIEPDGPTGFKIGISPTLNEGTESYVKFRAIDLAGNGPTESMEYYFKIDTTPVEYIAPKPISEQKLAKNNVKCSITIQDLAGSGVNLTTIQYRYTVAGIEAFSDWSDSGLALLVETGSGTENSEVSSTWIKDLKFKRNGDNYIQWRAKDLAGNGWTVSEAFKININALPTIIVKEIPENKKLYSNKKITFDADQTYDDDDHLTSLKFTWSSDITGELGIDRVIDAKLPSGKHEITINVFDGLNNASYKFNITVLDPEDAGKGSGFMGFGVMFDYLIILIIIICIVLSLFFVLYRRERKKRQYPEEREYTRLQTQRGPDITYIPPRQGRFPAGATLPFSGPTIDARLSSTQGISASGGVSGAQQITGVIAGQPAQPGSGVATQMPQLPRTIGSGTDTVVVGSSQPAGTRASLPQLPPAQSTVNAQAGDTGSTGLSFEIELLNLDPGKKLELLEQKMLLGQIPVELYTKLSQKFESELRTKQGRGPTIPPVNRQSTKPTPQVYIPAQTTGPGMTPTAHTVPISPTSPKSPKSPTSSATPIYQAPSKAQEKPQPEVAKPTLQPKIQQLQTKAQPQGQTKIPQQTQPQPQPKSQTKEPKDSGESQNGNNQ